MPFPIFDDFFLPVLHAADGSGTATVEAIREHVARELEIPENLGSAPAPSGKGSRLDHMITWAMRYLGRAGLIARTASRTFGVTEEGARVLRSGKRHISAGFLQRSRDFNGPARSGAVPDDSGNLQDGGDDFSWHFPAPPSLSEFRVPVLKILQRVGSASQRSLRAPALSLLSLRRQALNSEPPDPADPVIDSRLRSSISGLLSRGHIERVSFGIYTITYTGALLLEKMPHYVPYIHSGVTAPEPLPEGGQACPSPADAACEADGGRRQETVERTADIPRLPRIPPGTSPRDTGVGRQTLRHGSGAAPKGSAAGTIPPVPELPPEAGKAPPPGGRPGRTQIAPSHAFLYNLFGPGIFQATLSFMQDAVQNIERLINELDPESFARLAAAVAPGIWPGMDPEAPPPAEIRTVTASEARDGLDWLRIFARDMESRSAGPWALFTSGEFPPEAARLVDGLPGQVRAADAARMAALMYFHGVGVRTVRVLEMKEIDTNFFRKL
ncbi:MAG: hypothetical protein LBQ79_05935 [Deltaproteobacteria bacterium]|jgi:hypothetical protein|nr:hypothetical protein [Deltaproteobacteria bacterium]